MRARRGASSAPAKRCKPLDAVSFALALVACVAAGLAAWTPSGGAPFAVIESGGEVWIYPLSADALVRVRGALGESVIEIRDGGARFVESPCANKTCISSGTAHDPHDWIACLPNRVILRIESESPKGGADPRIELDGGAW
jgi:hypothetical protein